MKDCKYEMIYVMYCKVFLNIVTLKSVDMDDQNVLQIKSKKNIKNVIKQKQK